MTGVPQNLENLEKCPFFVNVSENLEKSGKNDEIPCKSRKGLWILVLVTITIKVFIGSYTCLQMVLVWSE